MRKGTLSAIAFVLSFIAAYGVHEMFLYYYPSVLTRSFGVKAAMSLVFTPLVLLVLTPLNRRILDKRKAAGRDIEEEERYESESGMISLTATDDK